ncbi:hypothetical protein EMIHUDRAFT_437594 [Emiliania huxleyi CCMP1516]|uniref:Uncharacterized protein n=2 Tax=Emiliania huxleyi TaxID=2903 RepID=A0A0D3IK75_EMIH1|nr:hypothetical protein EMIHUDRAFT_437594 [Emiliania huxleyi CCMP1516]EOD11660.1 hypothetical protein EMIHUDRAFT_437594 [Emiliania huxleyi CCMP1516]|eukprot:XP_005764089.1 hypothetical protein EMIHUDRAFT_437594 [Emiliania huxleyi CCMP1516]
MVRQGDWELQVILNGEAQPEHVIDGHHIVEARPGAKFSIEVTFHGEGTCAFDVELDGKKVDAMHAVDTTGQAPRMAGRKHIYAGFVKRNEGQAITSEFQYSHTRVEEGEGGGEGAGSGIASAPVDWSRGIITLRVRQGYAFEVKQDQHGISHQPDLAGPRASASERDMVKGGHSATAAASSSKAFGSNGQWKAGEWCVGPVQGAPELAELTLNYRDSFFLLLKGDKAKLLDPDPCSTEGCSDGVAKARANARRIVDAEERMRKIPKGPPVSIDLTGSDEEEVEPTPLD